MTITFDAPGMDSDPLFGTVSRQHVESDPCGEKLDWSKGLRAFSAKKGSPSSNSGSLLARVIEGEIIPRLLLAHSQIIQAKPELSHKDDLLSSINGEAFARLVLESEPDEIIEHVGALMDCGIKLERIFLDLLAPVARKLGEFWEEDRCTFAEVTLGLSRLHQVLHEIGRRKSEFTAHGGIRRRAYFAPSPGEQHTFGLSMLEEFFLHAGWETASNHGASKAVILQAAADQDLDVIGFSIGCKDQVEPLSDLVSKARKASRNREVAIMVGGWIFLENPELAGKFDPATIVTDGVHAVQIAENLISRRVAVDKLRKFV